MLIIWKRRNLDETKETLLLPHNAHEISKSHAHTGPLMHLTNHLHKQYPESKSHWNTDNLDSNHLNFPIILTI